MDSFMHNHQSTLDSQREDDAIRDLEDSGVYPDPNIEDIVEDEENFPPEDYEPSDLEMMASFGTMWHDWL
tara:strand:- start:211 stop:420 length:210 start_codon:yes stop_codon:yes gene_type:complete